MTVIDKYHHIKMFKFQSLYYENKCFYLELKRCKVILYLSCKEELAATREVFGMLKQWMENLK
jgi:hypothetical protein